MKKHLSLGFCLAISLLPISSASAKTLHIADKTPVISVDVPSEWTSERIEKGISCQSDDGEATIFFEVATAKSLDKLLDETIEWLKEQKVTIDESTKTESSFKAEGMEWSKISWNGGNAEWGKGDIAFVFGDMGNNRVAVITYWITEKGVAKHSAEIGGIFDSFKRL